MGEVLRTLPARCMPIFALDANAHVGSVEAVARGGTALLGSGGAARENAAGGMLREFAEEHQLLL
eukprot:2743511-Lingulodinium_polyedra.AAC.1